MKHVGALAYFFICILATSNFCFLYSMDSETKLQELEKIVRKFKKYDAKQIEDFLNNKLTKIPLTDTIINNTYGYLRDIFYLLPNTAVNNIESMESFAKILEIFIIEDKNNWFKGNDVYKDILLNEILSSFKHSPSQVLPFLEKNKLFNVLSEENKQKIFNTIEKEKLIRYNFYKNDEEKIALFLKALKQYDTTRFTPYENFLKFKIALKNFNESVDKQKQKIMQEIVHNNVDLSSNTIKNLVKTMIEENFSNTLLNDFDIWTKTTQGHYTSSQNNLDGFAWALKNINKTSPNEKSVDEENEIFLGPLIEKHYPKRLISVDKTYNKQHNNKIYQMRVLQQKAPECALYAFRNALYLIDMLSHSYNDEFNKIYNQMNNEEQYEKFIATTGCKRNIGASKEIINSIKEKINDNNITCIPECLPQNSKQYITQIKRFTYYHPPKKYISAFSFSKELQENEQSMQGILDDQKKFTDAIAERIKKIEPKLLNSDQVILDITSLFGNDVQSLADSIRNFQQSPDGLIAWDLGTLFTSHLQTGPHAVVLAEHKHKNNVEYVFADSNNSILGEDLGITATIDRIISLTRNIDYFNDILTRWVYYEFIYYLDIHINENKQKNYDPGLQSVYNQLKTYDLLQNKLYQNYYKPELYEFTKKLKKKFPDNQKYYNDMLKLFT